MVRSGASPTSQHDARSESAHTTASSGTKRKRAAEQKFYAVKEGKEPGIYHSWADCFEQVKGVKGALFKSFTSLTEAEGFMNGKPTKSQSVSKFYAVQNGRIPGVYTDWPSAQKQITGWKLPKHKSFATRAEAERFIAEGRNQSIADATSSVGADDLESEMSAEDGRSGCKVGDTSPSAKRIKKSPEVVILTNGVGHQDDVEPGTGPLPADAEDGFDRTVFLNPKTGKIERKKERQLNTTKLVATDSKGWLEIYTDGSSLGNGRVGAISGVGVFFGPNDPRNVSEALNGLRQTNQRAELTAIQRALDIAPIDRDVRIYTDSKYSIECVTNWCIKWQSNGWKASDGKAVENRDIVEPVINRMAERKQCNAKTEYVYVKGHANNPGNVAADNLAVNGARMAQALNAAKSE